MLVDMDRNIRGYYGVLGMSSDLRVFDEWESIPMITPPFLSSCVFAFGERRILREEGDCADDDGDTAGGRLFKRIHSRSAIG